MQPYGYNLPEGREAVHQGLYPSNGKNGLCGLDDKYPGTSYLPADVYRRGCFHSATDHGPGLWYCTCWGDDRRHYRRDHRATHIEKS